MVGKTQGWSREGLARFSESQRGGQAECSRGVLYALV